MPQKTITYGPSAAYPFTDSTVESGLTKREYFAACALGLMAVDSAPDTSSRAHLVAQDAVMIADALIAALNADTAEGA